MNSSADVKDFLLNYFDAHKDALLEEFFTFLRFESISTEPGCAPKVRACGEWLQATLQAMGLKAEIWETAGHPVVFAEYRAKNPTAPTVLIYNHYDVQPVDPIELWQTPPFEPAIRNGEIYARGAEDNKGQCFYVLAAVRALIEQYEELPVNLRLLIEGEEEIGSKNLAPLLIEKQAALAADYLLVVDFGFPTPQNPAVTLGCRGIVTFTVCFEGSNGDLHSGEHGGIVFNPNHALVQVLSSLRDADTGEIRVPGFYDDVRELTAAERSSIWFDFDWTTYDTMFKAKPSGGERAYRPLESAWLRPTLELNGIYGGYSGDGFKTVIPAKAMAKVSCRLVPDQDPEKVLKLVKNAIVEKAPEGITVSFEGAPGLGRPLRTSPLGPGVTAAREAFSEVLGIPCTNILAGGSIPILANLKEASAAETILLGFGLPDDQIHAPNERFGIDRIKKGMGTIGSLLYKLAALS